MSRLQRADLLVSGRAHMLYGCLVAASLKPQTSRYTMIQAMAGSKLCGSLKFSPEFPLRVVDLLYPRKDCNKPRIRGFGGQYHLDLEYDALFAVHHLLRMLAALGNRRLLTLKRQSTGRFGN